MKEKKRNAIIISISCTMLVLGVTLLSLNYLIDKKNNAFETINLRINGNKEPRKVDKEPEKPQENTENTKKPNYTPRYIGILEIPKINLTKGFYSIDSKRNNVDYGLQVIKPSSYPDVDKGMFIIASHSGSASISYFKHLYKIKTEDVVYVHYNQKKYIYVIKKIYTQPKNGQIEIYRNYDVSTIVLVTCTRNDNKTQTVYIGDLTKVEDKS